MGSKTIMIGGIEREYEILFHKRIKYLIRWNSQFQVCKNAFKRENGREYEPKDRMSIPPDFYFWVLWKCLKKKGSLFWKKPFRSRVHMKKHVWEEEFQPIVDFINIEVLKRAQ